MFPCISTSYRLLLFEDLRTHKQHARYTSSGQERELQPCRQGEWRCPEDWRSCRIFGDTEGQLGRLP